MDKELEKKMEDAGIDGSAIAFDPDEAEELGATPDDMPLKDVVEAMFDDEIF